MLVSTTAASASKANASTARAVYGPDARQRQQASRACAGTRRAATTAGGRGVEVRRPTRVAEALPQPQHVAERRRRARRRRGERLEEREVLRHHPRHLRLLQHHLAHQDRPRVAGAAPRQVAQPRRGPAEHAVGERRHDELVRAQLQAVSPSYGRCRDGRELALPHHHPTAEVADLFAVLVEALGLDGDDAAVGLRRALLHRRAPGSRRGSCRRGTWATCAAASRPRGWRWPRRSRRARSCRAPASRRGCRPPRCGPARWCWRTSRWCAAGGGSS